MDLTNLFNWFTVVLATSAAIVAGGKSAELSSSFPYLFFLAIFLAVGCVVALILHTTNSSTSKIALRARKLNSSLCELYTPPGTPNIEVLFLHGFQLGDYKDAHLLTWQSGDGSCIWPQTWLVEKFPDARILSVSYNSSVISNCEYGSFDMYIICENLASDLLDASVGQEPNRPIVLVGHSFGGLVIKELCVYASSETSKRKIDSVQSVGLNRFLENIKGIFFYATPHHGISIVDMAAHFVAERPLLEFVKILSSSAARLNFEFDKLCGRYEKWQIVGLGESLPTKWGRFDGLVVVREAAARYGSSFNLVEGANHITICRPTGKASRSFKALTNFLQNISTDSKRELEALEEASHQNMEHLPNQITGMDFRLEQVKSRLEKSKRLGLVGMGGVGKTTLAKAIYNNWGATFEYSCFVPDVKLITGTIASVKVEVWKHMHCNGTKVGDGGWPNLRGKRLLLLLDDISDDRDIQILSEIADGSSLESCFIATSRNRELLKNLDDIYEVPVLNKNDSKELFRGHAFPNEGIIPPKLKSFMVDIVEKCGGLPLALEVVGKYLKGKENDSYWMQTLHALGTAEAITDLNKRLWATLRLSYDGLEEKEQQMFLDAATFFNNKGLANHPWTLGEAKVAWREAYDTDCESLLWQTLVDRSLVYDVLDHDVIRVHEQLESLGRMIASKPRSRVWEKAMALSFLQTTNESHTKEIQALQLVRHPDCYGVEIHTSSRALRNLKLLQYLEVDAPILVDGAQEAKLFPRKLVLLSCVSLRNLIPPIQNHLVVLRLYCRSEDCLPKSIGNLAALKILRLLVTKQGGVWDAIIMRIPDEIGCLSQLEYLEFSGFVHLEKLPDTFGRLSSLKHLKFSRCYALCALPESFGRLSTLRHLCFDSCQKLEALVDSFGDLYALEDLKFHWCSNLQALPETFGRLSALKYLEFYECEELNTLPESFGHLRALKHLEFKFCNELHTLPESFGQLCALDDLKFEGCGKLLTLPESFGHLLALERLEFNWCSKLRALPETFGHLHELEHLEFHWCSKLESLPETFGHLSALKHLEFFGCEELHTLREPFGSLRALGHLKFKSCGKLLCLPESFGHLGALEHLEFAQCGELHVLPESFGALRALVQLKFIACPKLKTLPKSLFRLSTLSHLELVDCGNLYSMIPYRQLAKLQYLKISVAENLPDSVAELLALRHLTVDRILMKSIPDYIKSMPSLETLELARLPSVKELPPWLGQTSVGPLGLSRKSFRVQDGNFYLIGETNKYFGDVLWHWQDYIPFFHEGALQKLRISDYDGAIANLCPADLGDLQPEVQGFVLQERGIVKRIMGDFRGALEDLTAALRVFLKSDSNRQSLYDCWKHRGFVNFLLGDLDGAQSDGGMALKLLASSKGQYPSTAMTRSLGEEITITRSLGEELVTYMHFRLIGRREFDEEETEWVFSHNQMMEKVRASDFHGALEIWKAFDARLSGYHGRVRFFHEMGLLKRLIGNLDGALEDLTAALEIDHYDYECYKHRGYVKYLLGDIDGARIDAQRCVAMGLNLVFENCLGTDAVEFLEFKL